MIFIIKNDDGMLSSLISHQKVQIYRKDIVRLQACINYTEIFFAKNPTPLKSGYTLKFFEDCLPEEQFIRLNKSNIVNIDRIKGVRLDEIVLEDNSRIVISRRRFPLISEFLNNNRVKTISLF